MDTKNKHIFISGNTGFIGSNLTKFLESKGYIVLPITREILAYETDKLCAYLENADIIINLAGAPIAKRWTKSYKEELYTSRINPIATLNKCMTIMDKKPSQFLSVSAVGIYGNDGGKDEDSVLDASGFLADLGRKWEEEALKASVNTAVCRMGIVLGKNGGALAKMLPPFKFGLGGRLGSGNQYMSWIHLEDVLRAFHFIIEQKATGFYNFTAPQPIRNKDFTKTLAKSLKRPAIFFVPKWTLKFAMGEAATVLLDGQEVYPKALQNAGFEFKFSNIEKALGNIIKEPQLEP